MITRDENPVTRPTFRLLLVVSDIQEAEILWPLACTIVDERQGQLLIMHAVAVAEEESLSEGASRARQSREALRQFIEGVRGEGGQIETSVRVGHDIWSDIWATVHQELVDVLLVGWRSESMPETAVQHMSDPCLVNPPCDVIVVRLGPAITGRDWWDKIRRILLPVRGDPGNSLVLRVASTLAEATDSTVTVLHATNRVSYDVEQDWNMPISYTLDGLPRLTRSVVRTGSPTAAILEEAKEHEVVVMGSTRWPMDPDDWSGPIVNKVASESQSNLLVVKERASQVIHKFQAREAGIPKQTPLSIIVDKWFAENTFHSDEFSDLERLLVLKAERGVTISLGLPALNEERTVGKVIRTIKSALMDRIPLLDEIVLIDSKSEDRTREIAASLGIPVYIHQQILPRYGARCGKGEALWKSLHVLKGDIIVWIDTDIHNPDPRFVYGVVGPLLQDCAIQYVKGFYRRPILEDGRLRPGGGGRVTELTCRPLFNLLFPDLSGMIQPLSGEYAGRRSALEQVPFFCGYGVETGLLIDIWQRYGLQAIAQVDLLERIHRNQPLLSLSKMSFAILQVILRRLEDRHGLHVMEEINKTMKLVRYLENGYWLEEEEIRELERPPITRLPEYLNARRLVPVWPQERTIA